MRVPPADPGHVSNPSNVHGAERHEVGPAGAGLKLLRRVVDGALNGLDVVSGPGVTVVGVEQVFDINHVVSSHPRALPGVGRRFRPAHRRCP